MLDVHPPHAPTHTWRDFFLHIATIVVGLLIAIGLEQSVEALNRHHDRAELLQALNRESAQIVHDATTSEARDTALLSYLQTAFDRVKSNIVDHTPYADPPGVTLRTTVADSPDDPIYKAARASGKLALLSDREVTAYGELDQMIALGRQTMDHPDAASLTDHLRTLQLYRSKDNPKSYTAVPPEELRQLYIALGRSVDLQMHVLIQDYQAGGAANDLLKGERDLGKIQQAERPPMSNIYTYH